MRILRVSVRRKRINVLFLSEKIELDGEFSADGGLIIDRDTYDCSGYKEGDDISSEELCSLIAASRNARAYSRALWLLDSRDYSAKAMLGKLKQLYGEQAAQNAVDRLRDAEIIDDERFAQRAAEFMLESGRSERDSVMRLAQRGVPYDVAREAVRRVSAECEVDPVEQIRALIDKKYAARLLSGDRKELQRVVAAIARKGFGFDDIRSAISGYCDELEADG